MIVARRLITLVFVWGMLIVPALAQQPVRVDVRVEDPGVPGYDTGGRRDPFISLISLVKAPSAARPASGLAAIAVTEVVVKGIIKSGAMLLAILEGPDGRTYIARRQDRLYDGTVKLIEAESVVFVERTPDVFGNMQSRDVRKALRPAPEVIR